MPRPVPPLNRDSLERLALRYVERFATTRAKLVRYLANKIRTCGWEGPPADPVALAERMAALGYVDDAAFAVAKAGALTRRGMGERRVREALRGAGVGGEEIEAAVEGIAPDALDAALSLARRRRIGPFAEVPADRALREKQLAAMLRAGHPLSLAQRIVALRPGDDLSDFGL